MPSQKIFFILFVKVTELFEYANVTGKSTGKYGGFMLKDIKSVE
jgi:hypothetical protein